MFSGIAMGVGALAGAAASMSAADEQANAIAESGRLTNAQFQTSRGDLMPWQLAGQKANSRLKFLMGLGPQLDENDPRIKARAEEIFNERDAAHRARYGVGLYDPGVDANARERILSSSTQRAVDEFLRSSPGSTDPAYGSLVRPFTMSDFEADPGYQFRLSEGEKAIERMARAGSGFNSGSTAKALLRFNQDFASNEYSNSWNRDRAQKGDVYSRLSGVSGTGVNAAGMTAGLGANAASQIANLNAAGGAANASGIVGATNAVTGAIGQYLNYSNSKDLLEAIRSGRGSSGIKPYTMDIGL